MRPTSDLLLIDVQALRVGMCVQLDIGWMWHPFPLSKFRITSAQQLATIHGLGLKQVRWDPHESELVVLEELVPGAESPAAKPAEPDAWPPVPAAGRVLAGDAGAATPEGGHAGDAGPSGRPAAERAGGGAATTPSRPQSDRARRLEAQQRSLHVCERQFAEATKACKQVCEMVEAKPQEAREHAEMLTRALVDKMLGEEEVCIRLLTHAAGDRASMHALNVMIVSLLMGRTFGFGEQDLLDIGVGAMLHDIGKLDMPLRVRHHDDSFAPSEQRDYEEHVAHGLAAARRMALSPGATLVIAQHHERADGGGFPLKINTDRMTPAARIVALVDRYDNLCNPYLLAKALTPHESLSLLFAQGKAKFDTSILGGFIRMMGVYPPGSTVQLTDDRYAMVVAVNSSRPLKPNVLVHDPHVPREQALVLDLESVGNIGIRRSIKPAQLPPAALEYLAPRQRVAYFFEPAGPAEWRS